MAGGQYPQTTCCITGCPARSTRYPGEWMCGKHYRMRGRVLGAELNAARLRWRRTLRRHPGGSEWWKMKPGSPERIECVEASHALDLAWARCKDKAETERFMP